MARKPTRKQARYTELRQHHFTPGEARMLKELPRNNPAREALIRDRDTRWERFERIARSKVERGKWRRGQVMGKWLANLSRSGRCPGSQVGPSQSGRTEAAIG